MDYEKEIDKNNVGLKETLKKILKDVDERIKEKEDGEDTETEG